jgi:hypothetical protein
MIGMSSNTATMIAKGTIGVFLRTRLPDRGRQMAMSGDGLGEGAAQ